MANLDFIDGNCGGEDQPIEIEAHMNIDLTRQVVAARKIMDLYANDCYGCAFLYVKCFPQVEFTTDGPEEIDIAVVSPGTDDFRSDEYVPA